MGFELGNVYRVLKLGGSLITNKNVPFSFNEELIVNIANVIKNFKVILIHGGGSFGHYAASLHEENVQTITSIAMQELNLKILKIFAKEKIPVFPIPGRYFNIENVVNILENNLIPVIYGDILPNGNIISGDDITLIISKYFHTNALFATDVEGIIINNKVVDVLKSLDNFKEIKISQFDVTGGIREKLRKIFQYKVNSLIFDGRNPTNIYYALSGKRIGTFVEAE
jgi:isopentenyl phosphate kinase